MKQKIVPPALDMQFDQDEEGSDGEYMSDNPDIEALQGKDQHLRSVMYGSIATSQPGCGAFPVQ